MSRLTRRLTWPWVVTLSASGFWAVQFSLKGSFQYLRYHMYAFDLGIFTQGIWLLSQAETPFVTVRGLHLFADHSSYILVLLAPIYAIAPTPVTLFVITAVGIAIAAVVVLTIATKAGARPLLATLTALLFLLAPAAQWQVRDVFHPEVLVIPLVLGAFALLQKGRDGWAIAAIVVALTAKEDVGLLVVPLGLAVAFWMGKRKTGAVIGLAGVFAFTLNFLVLLPALSPTNELLYSARYSNLGDSPVGILVGLTTSPDVWWDVVTSGTRIWYVIVLLAAMPLCLFASKWLLIGFPALLANVTSLHGYQAEIQWHYTASLIVVVAIAGAYGAARVDRWRDRRVKLPVVLLSVVVAFTFWLVAGPGSVWAQPHPVTDQIDRMLELVPDGDSVSAWTTFVPALANRSDIYMFPNPFEELNYSAPGVPTDDIEDPEWLVLRRDSYRDWDNLIAGLQSSGRYRMVYDDPPFFLLRRAE